MRRSVLLLFLKPLVVEVEDHLKHLRFLPPDQLEYVKGERKGKERNGTEGKGKTRKEKGSDSEVHFSQVFTITSFS